MTLLKHLGILGLVGGMIMAGDIVPASAQGGLAIRPASDAALTAPVRNTYGRVQSIVGPVLTMNVGGRDTRFVVDENTDVLARGAGKASRNAGGRLPITALVHSGDIARVSYRERDGAMYVREIQIRGRATNALR